MFLIIKSNIIELATTDGRNRSQGDRRPEGTKKDRARKGVARPLIFYGREYVATNPGQPLSPCELLPCTTPGVCARARTRQFKKPAEPSPCHSSPAYSFHRRSVKQSIDPLHRKSYCEIRGRSWCSIDEEDAGKMDGGRRLQWRLSPACLLLAVAVVVAMPGLAAARTRHYTFNVRTPPLLCVISVHISSMLALRDGLITYVPLYRV
jgi:hypothetical protein